MDAKKNLYKAIYKLLQNHDIEQITIEMILKESDVSRTSFYRHFRDKFDLMHWYYGYFMDNNLINSDESFFQITHKSAVFIYENKTFFQNAIKYKGQNSYLDYLFQRLMDFCTGLYKKRNNVSELSTQEKLAIEYHCAGTVQILKSWVESGMKLVPDEFIPMFYNNMPDILKKGLR